MTRKKKPHLTSVRAEASPLYGRFSSQAKVFFPCYFPAETAVGEVKERLGELETSQRRWRRRRQGLRDVQLELLQEKKPVRGFNTKSIWLRGAITLCVLAEADGCCLPGHRAGGGPGRGGGPAVGGVITANLAAQSTTTTKPKKQQLDN